MKTRDETRRTSIVKRQSVVQQPWNQQYHWTLVKNFFRKVTVTKTPLDAKSEDE